MQLLSMSRTTRLSLVLAVSVAFFGAEIGIGFKTRSLALIADAFHYLNDIISYAMALFATRLASRAKGPPGYTYAFRRAEIVGAFFNATFLLALGVSIFLQAIERFVNLPEVDNPLWVLIVGAIGLALNIASMTLVHEHGHGHGHSHGHDPTPGQEHNHGGRHTHDHAHTPKGHSNGHSPVDAASTTQQESRRSGSRSSRRHRTSMAEGEEDLVVELNRMSAPGYGFGEVDHSGHNHSNAPDMPEAKSMGLAGVAIHLMGDAVNNVGVILAAAIMWKVDSPKKYYADPAASLAIALIIIFGAIPLSLRSSRVLLEAAPKALNLTAITEDLRSIPGVREIHDLHVWHLTESDLLATLHCRTTADELSSWTQIERELQSCFLAYGINHVTISPEVNSGASSTDDLTCAKGCLPSEGH